MTNCPHCGALLATPQGVCPSCQRQLFELPPVPPTPPTPMSAAPVRASSSKAIWLVVAAIGCFGLVAVGGIIAAILIPNFADAVQKAKAKRTMGDLRTIMLAIEEHGTDHGAYPQAQSFAEMLTLVDAPTTPLATHDGWQREFRYQCIPSADALCDGYGVWSSGRDGVFECEDVRCYQAGTTSPDRDDIVVRDGQFVRHPATSSRRD
jgi:type II secretory pathway pseudopilin PulG